MPKSSNKVDQEISELRAELIDKENLIAALQDRLEYLQSENRRLALQIELNSLDISARLETA